MDPTAFLIIYGIAVLAILMSLYALIEIKEAKDNGRHWIDLNRQLIDRLEELERKSKRTGPIDPFKKG